MFGFGHKNQNVRGPKDNTDTPAYPDVIGEIDAIIGSEKKNTAHFKMISLVEAAVIVILSLGIVYVATLSKTVLQAIQILPNGQAIPSNGVVIGSDFKAPDSSVSYYLNEFIVKSFSVLLDKKWLTKNINDEFFYIGSDNASSILNAALKKRGPFQLLDKRVRVDVQVESCLKLNANNWQAEWYEIRSDSTDPKGSILSKVKYRGVFLIDKRAPTPETKDFNPAGIYITNMDMQEIQL